ncbi:MAG: zinc-ribbon domain-containing protein [Candidatus Hermodarchaeota archaeon]
MSKNNFSELVEEGTLFSEGHKMRCKRCGNELPKRIEFCPYCGYQLIKRFTVSVPQLKVLDHTALHIKKLNSRKKLRLEIFRGRNVTNRYPQILSRNWKIISLAVLVVFMGVFVILVFIYILLFLSFNFFIYEII